MKLSLFSLVCLIINTSTVFGLLEECPSEGVSYLPHPDCTRYIICVKGEGLEATCPTPLYYNPRTERCGLPEDVPECVGGTRPPVSTTTVLTSTTTEAPPYNALTQCGQTIKADSGYIQYKLNQNYDAGELCAFIIQLDRRTGCDFTLEASGIYDTNLDTLTVFKLPGFKQDLQSIKLDSVNSTTYLLDVTFAVVLTTTTNLGTGFRLRFRGRPEFSSYYPGSLLVFNKMTNVPLKFPFDPEQTGGAEFDVVIVTSGAKLLTDPESTFELILYDYSVNLGCDSWFDVHTFDGTITRLEERTCVLNLLDGEKKQLTFKTKGLFIILFLKSQFLSGNYFGSIEWFEPAAVAIK